jgi:hypothetical protein
MAKARQVADEKRKLKQQYEESRKEEIAKKME